MPSSDRGRRQPRHARRGDGPAQPPPDAEVLIVGGGVAGASAALFAAAAGLSVTLVDDPPASDDATCYEWTNPGVWDLLRPVGVSVATKPAAVVRRLTLFDADGRRRADVEAPVPLSIVAGPALRDALRTAARRRGVRIRHSRAIDLRPGEQSVHVRCADGSALAGRFLLLADGASSTFLQPLGLGATDATCGMHCCCWTGSAPRRSAGGSRGSARAATPDASLSLLLGTRGAMGFGYVLRFGPHVQIGLSEDAPPHELRARFAALARSWHDRDLLTPLAAPPGDGAATVRPIPRGHALERHAHVAKRTLVIGDAGGFVAALQQDGLYPAVWSARLAVDVLVGARQERVPQERLRAFDALWRAAMSDYLRPPDTEMPFLLPLIFSNPSLAARFARSFAAGPET